jgi:hypothetical protein
MEMKGRRLRELTGAGFILSTLFVGAQQAGADQQQDSDSTGSEQEFPDSSIDRARMITGLGGWPGIRSLWRELDQMEPGDQGYSFGAMEWEQANLMREKLNSLAFEMIAELEAANVSTLELELVTEVARMRLEMMSWGMPSMMTRMMPPPIEYDKGALVEDLEAKIDHLLELRESGMLSLDQVRSATGSILDTFVAISIVNVVSNDYGYPYTYDFSSGYALISDPFSPAYLDSTVNAVEMVDLVMADLERHYRSITSPDAEVPDHVDAEEVRERYEDVTDSIEAIRNSTSGVAYLLGDLLLGVD